MASVLKPPPPSPPLVTTTPDERSARRDLLEQIARIESDLSALFCSAYPRGGFDWLQLLVHPEIWVYPGGTMGETMRAMLAAESERRLAQLADDGIDVG